MSAPPDLDGWLDRVDRTDPQLIYFAGELVELERHGLQPRQAVVLLLRASGEREAEAAVASAGEIPRPHRDHTATPNTA